MEVAEMDEALKVLDSSLSLIKWRLKSPSKRRLEIDILALCTGMRPTVMVDYGGKMPELQERLCQLMKLIQKESPIFEYLRVMVIEDMIYLIHVGGLVEHIRLSLSSEAQLLFVDLEQDPPKMTQAEKSPIGMQLVSIQKSFSLLFPQDGMKDDLLSCHWVDNMADAKSSTNELVTSQSSAFVDLSSCMQDAQVTVPTLNGWLLGYPVVYLFGKEHIADAIYNLSTKSLRIFKISVTRNSAASKGSQLEELLSFSVPYDLSMGGSNEQWAGAFLANMQEKWGRCKQVWRSLQMEMDSHGATSKNASPAPAKSAAAAAEKSTSATARFAAAAEKSSPAPAKSASAAAAAQRSLPVPLPTPATSEIMSNILNVDEAD